MFDQKVAVCYFPPLSFPTSQSSLLSVYCLLTAASAKSTNNSESPHQGCYYQVEARQKQHKTDAGLLVPDFW